MLIGICGKLGVGKDYITTNYIIPLLEQKREQFLQLAFADQIKVNVMSKMNVPYREVYETKTKETRILLQEEGTRIRNEVSPTIWIDYLHNWIEVFRNRGIAHFIISDVRFKNELEYIKSNGGILIKIVAPQRNHRRLMNESNGNLETMQQISSHRSECDLDNLPDNSFDIVLNNDPHDQIDLGKIESIFN